jgi:hypothetical protein
VSLLAVAGTVLGVTAAASASAPTNAKNPISASALARPGAVQSNPRPQVRLSGAALSSAADQCAAWASDAGFANNGYLTGSLTTAVAVALAESNCDPRQCWDNTLKHACSEASQVPGDSVDRGAWQLNTITWSKTPNACAYAGQCSANAAYFNSQNGGSEFGTFFAPWVTYSSDAYAAYLTAAQQAVNGLKAGKVASGVVGSCLGYPSDRRGAAAQLANCNSNTPQIWHLVGGTLRTSAGLCLTATSSRRTAKVDLMRCNGSAMQRWNIGSFAQLNNPGARRCLSDPVNGTAGDKPGITLVAASCLARDGDAWYKP